MSVTESKDLVSIPLCTFNGEAFLAMQLDSLLAQTHKNFELLIFDDASTDRTSQILAEYARCDDRIKLHSNQVNMGFKGNFSQALSQCRGVYVAPCDQDDIWLPEKITMLIAALKDKALVYCDSELIDAHGVHMDKKLSDRLHMFDINNPLQLVLDNCVSGHAMLFRRELLLQALPIPAEFFHDWWIAAVAATSASVVYCPLELVKYRQHERSVTDVMKLRVAHALKRPPGRRLRTSRDVAQRLESLSQLPGKQQGLLTKLAVLWKRREAQWLSWRLCLLVLRHRNNLFVMKRRSSWRNVLSALSLLPGIKLKRVLSPRAYQTPPCQHTQ